VVEKDMRRRKFLVVSPNVGNHSLYWRQASVACEAAFMGYKPDNQKHKQIGFKFAHVVRPNDVLLIARRHRGEPEVAGFGVVVGKFKTKLKGFRPQYKFGSLRKLSPFKPRSAAPPKLLIKNALGRPPRYANFTRSRTRSRTPPTGSSASRWSESLRGRQARTSVVYISLK
jgi:hypothetical protein